MVRDTGKHSPHSPDALFSATQAPVPSSPRFWVRLLSHRPLTVLGSLWLITICVAAVAAQRLVFNNPDRSAAAPSQVQASRSAARTPPRADANLSADSPEDTGADSTTVRPRQKSKVTLWGFSSLVGLCALGSWAITHQAKAATRRRAKRRVRRVKPRAKGSTGPKRLQPYSPDRDAIIVKGARAVVDTLPLTLARADGSMEAQLHLNLFDDPVVTAHNGDPGAIAPQPRAASRPRDQSRPAPDTPSAAPKAQPAQAESTSPSPKPMAANAGEPHQPEVLSDEEAHPLDWEEDSLAHALDLRQRRSLSSLM